MVANTVTAQSDQYNPKHIAEFQRLYHQAINYAAQNGLALSVVESQVRDTACQLDWQRRTILGCC